LYQPSELQKTITPH